MTFMQMWTSAHHFQDVKIGQAHIEEVEGKKKAHQEDHGKEYKGENQQQKSCWSMWVKKGKGWHGCHSYPIRPRVMFLFEGNDEKS